jgi:CHASE3 domain sensor protein
MDPKDFTHQLAEVREEYRRVRQEQLELSRKAVKRQKQRLYQRIVAVGGVGLVAVVLFLAWLAGAFR